MEKSKACSQNFVLCMKRVLNDEPRTTNVLEGWHRRFGTLLARYHPNIYDFIGCLRPEHARTDNVLSKLLMGNAPEGMRKCERNKTQRLKNVVAKFAERQPMEYLRGLELNIKHNVV